MKIYNVSNCITKFDLCCSCGACQYICSFDNIQMKFDTILGKWQAIVINSEQCKSCNGRSNCLSVCPSYSIDYHEIVNNENQMGKILSVWNGWSNNEDIRLNSSSGGLIRTLCNYLLQTKRVDGVISLKHESGFEYFPAHISA